MVTEGYSRANAPTGSAGEESVSSLLLLLLLLSSSSLLLLFTVVVVVVVVDVVDVVDVDVDVDVVVVVVARGFVGTRARARREPAHMWKGVSGAHKLSQNHGIYDVFAASEKTKIEDKDSEKAITLYFTMFLACRVRKLAFRKVPKTSLFTVFCTPTEDKTTLRAMFSHSQNPKMKPKQWYLRCFCNSEKGVFGECRKTKINIRMAKIQKHCILRCCFPFR